MSLLFSTTAKGTSCCSAFRSRVWKSKPQGLLTKNKNCRKMSSVHSRFEEENLNESDSKKTYPRSQGGIGDGHKEENHKSCLRSTNFRDVKVREKLDCHVRDPALIDLSPSQLTYTGGTTIPVTSLLHIVKPEEDTPSGTWPVFRLMDENGKFRQPLADGYKHRSSSVPIEHSPSTHTSFSSDLDALRTILEQEHPGLGFSQNPILRPVKHEFPDVGSTNTLMRAYTQMIRLREMDSILQNAQRQGRISFYMTCRGEEAIHIGSAVALSMEDVVLAQYREAGLLMWRGFTLQQFADQCFSNQSDLGKGRQMPIHYGCRALNYQTISSPLGTQLPQAVGAAYRLKIQGKQNVSIVFFGDGCASTTDFHSACNFAATLKVPVIFFCRNNGYAISTPVSEQYAGDGIISRCKGYGMAGIRIDGNDLFAVSAAVQAAKKFSLENSAPVMIEAMTYRQGHHSTSDDSSRYRNNEEVDSAGLSDPLLRLSSFLTRSGIIEADEPTRMEDAEKIAVIRAMELAEKKPKPSLEGLFTDVYKEKPKHLQLQEDNLLKHLSLHKVYIKE